MSVTVETPLFQIPGPDEPSVEPSEYWWTTSGWDLARMLSEAKYRDDAQRQFLYFFRDTICPLLGGRPDADSLRSGVGWDGNPFEYSFELKNTSRDQAVRFVVDVSQLRPADTANPLGVKNFETVLGVLAKRTPGFDNAWYAALKKWFVHSHLPTAEQRALVNQVGYQMPMILGFDIPSSRHTISHLSCIEY